MQNIRNFYICYSVQIVKLYDLPQPVRERVQCLVQSFRKLLMKYSFFHILKALFRAWDRIAYRGIILHIAAISWHI